MAAPASVLLRHRYTDFTGEPECVEGNLIKASPQCLVNLVNPVDPLTPRK